MGNKKIYQLGLCLVIATVLALTAHIYILGWVKPTLDLMMQGTNPPPEYSPFIISAAYVTAFIRGALVVFLYYQTQHLLPIKSQPLKALLVACILLEINDNLIRQPLMNILVNHTMGMHGLKPYLFEALNMLDKWVSALVLALAVVYLCPKKYKKLPNESS